MRITQTMKFKEYIKESGVFDNKKIDKKIINKNNTFIIVDTGEIDDFDTWSIGKNIIKSKPFSKAKFYSKIMSDKGDIYYLVGGSKTSSPGKFDMSWESSPTGRLKIETTMMLKYHKSSLYETPTLSFPAYIFDNVYEITSTINEGLDNMKNLPDYIVNTIKSNMAPPFYKFDWGDIKEKTERNEIAVYFGEILVALSLLNNEMSVFKGDLIPKGEAVSKVIFPKDPSFKAVDSMIETDKKTIIKISSKKGKGAAASLYGNVISHIIDYNINVSGTVLDSVVNTSRGYNLKRDVISAMYNWAFVNLKEFKRLKLSSDQFKSELINYKNKGKSDYIDDFNIVSKRIKKGRYPHFKGKKLDNLPFSISHFISGEMAEKLNKDKKAMDMILRILGEENYFQVSLDNSFVKTGKAKYISKHSGSNNIRILSSRATYNDPKLSQAKINYEIY